MRLLGQTVIKYAINHTISLRLNKRIWLEACLRNIVKATIPFINFGASVIYSPASLVKVIILFFIFFLKFSFLQPFIDS